MGDSFTRRVGSKFHNSCESLEFVQEMKEDVYCGMRISVCFVAISVWLLRCGDSSSSPALTDSVVDSSVSVLKGDTTLIIVKLDISSRSNHSHISKDSFLLDSFVVLLDSFCTDFAGRDITVTATVDPVTDSDVRHAAKNYVLRKTDGAELIWYHFDMGDNTMNFSIAEGRYPDNASASAMWKEVLLQSGPPNDSLHDPAPCISYGSDYVFRTGNKIFWLTTACHWSYAHHKLFRTFLHRTVYSCTIQSEIKCRCGAMSPGND